MKAYKTAIETIIKDLDVSPDQGLSLTEVQKRQEKYGYNTLKTVKQRTILSIFISQFQNPLVYILFFAALIIFVFGEDKLDAFIISGVLFFNAILGTVQEARTKNIIESLKRYIKTESVVLRDGAKTVVDDKDLVVGDIILLQEGQRVPADARVLTANNLRVDEAVLTGEAHTIEKHTDTIEQDVPLGDRKNMVFKGTYIVAGAGKAIVTAIATDTEIGKIQVIAEEIDTDIPLRKELERVSHWILIFILITCLFLFAVGLLTGKPIKELLVMLTALFICVVPEGLPVVLTLVLAAGALQMAKHFVLVRNMQAVEALGRTDVIVIDKTGTLTRNEMVVSRAWTQDTIWHISGQGYHNEGTIEREEDQLRERDINVATDPILIQMGIAAALLNNAEIIHLPKLDVFEIKGDPTEAALFVFSQKMGSIVTEQFSSYTKVYEIPFSSTLRYHAGFYAKNNSGECVAFIIGSPETVLKRSAHEDKKTNTALQGFLDNGLRVVAIGIKQLPPHTFDNFNRVEDYQALLETNIQLLGFAGIEDSIRLEVATAIQDARNAGLSIIMATGDHQVTALHVAKKVGIFRQGDDYVDGSEIDTMNDEALLQRINHITVFSRVSAQHKMRIVQLLL
jgi:P-type Ca2+ transporter type 2C